MVEDLGCTLSRLSRFSLSPWVIRWVGPWLPDETERGTYGGREPSGGPSYKKKTHTFLIMHAL